MRYSAAIKVRAYFNGIKAQAGLNASPEPPGLLEPRAALPSSASDSRRQTYDPRVARDFARLVGGWWRGATAGKAWMLSLTLAALVVGNIGLNVTVNAWNRMFFDALERRDSGTLVFALVAFAGLVVVIAAAGVLIVVTRETLQVRWREWLVGRLKGLWLGRQR